MALTLMYITNSAEVALVAEKYGVDRIWIDLETLGKEERQKNMNTVKSNHSVEDVERIKPVLSSSELLVRVNPINAESENEINAVINAGADIIMLPMWKTPEEVEQFLGFVNGRIRTTLLLETKEAVQCLDRVLKYEFDELHIGLNDLHLSYGLTFMFELLSNGVVELICKKVQEKGIPYGFGGIAKIGDGLLPAEKIVTEHYRLGSTRAILSRTFCDNALVQSIEEIERVFRINMQALREFESGIANLTEDAFFQNQKDVRNSVEEIVRIMKEKKNAAVR